jgi:transposase
MLFAAIEVGKVKDPDSRISPYRPDLRPADQAITFLRRWKYPICYSGTWFSA